MFIVADLCSAGLLFCHGFMMLFYVDSCMYVNVLVGLSVIEYLFLLVGFEPVILGYQGMWIIHSFLTIIQLSQSVVCLLRLLHIRYSNKLPTYFIVH